MEKKLETTEITGFMGLIMRNQMVKTMGNDIEIVFLRDYIVFSPK